LLTPTRRWLWGQTREDIKSDHVLLRADHWLEWVER
jgi:hypothetical protein